MDDPTNLEQVTLGVDTQGRTETETIRCLKRYVRRYVARELYPELVAITPTLVPANGPTSSSGST